MIDLNDDYVAKSFSNEDCYEPLMIREWLKKASQSKGSILDIGASTGLYSLLASACNRFVYIHAFEPFARAVSRLVNNKELNGFPKIKIHPFAVGDQPGLFEFTIKNFEGPITTGGGLGGESTLAPLVVQVRRVSDVIPSNESVSLIKIDVEGHELAVLKSIEPSLRASRPSIFFEALSPTAFSAITKFLLDLGYTVKCLDERAGTPVAVDPDASELPDRNFLAEHPDSRS